MKKTVFGLPAGPVFAGVPGSRGFGNGDRTLRRPGRGLCERKGR